MAEYTYLTNQEKKLLHDAVNEAKTGIEIIYETLPSTGDIRQPIYMLFPPSETNHIIARSAIEDFQYKYNRLPDLKNTEDSEYLGIYLKLHTTSLSGIENWPKETMTTFLEKKNEIYQSMGTYFGLVDSNSKLVKYFNARVERISSIFYDYWQFRKLDSPTIKNILATHPEAKESLIKMSPNAYTLEGAIEVNNHYHQDLINISEVVSTNQREVREVKDYLVRQGATLENIEAMSAANFEFAIMSYRELKLISNEIAQQKQKEHFKAHFDTVTGVGKLMMQVGQMNNDPTLAKVGGSIAAVSHIAFSLTQLTAAPIGFLSLNPATAVIGGMLTLFTILGSDNDENESFQQAFNALMSAIDNLHKDMKEEFKQVHREIFLVYEAVKELYERNEHNTSKLFSLLKEMAEFQKYALDVLVKMGSEILLNDANAIINNIKDNTIRSKGAEVNFEALDKLKNVANLNTKSDSFNTPLKLADDIFNDSNVKLNLETKPASSNIGFLVNYASRLGVLHLPEGREVANPLLYNRVTKPMGILATTLLSQDRDKYEQSTNTALTEVIKTGTILTTALTELKKQNFLAKLYHHYFDAVHGFKIDLDANLEAARIRHNWPVSLSLDIDYAANNVATIENYGKYNNLEENGGIPFGENIAHYDIGCYRPFHNAHFCDPHNIPEGVPSSITNTNWYHLAKTLNLGNFFMGDELWESKWSPAYRGAITYSQLGFDFYHHKYIALTGRIFWYGHISGGDHMWFAGNGHDFDWYMHRHIARNFVDQDVANKVQAKFYEARNDFFNKLLDIHENNCRLKPEKVVKIHMIELMIKHTAELLSQTVPSSCLAKIESYLCSQRHKKYNENLSLDIENYYHENCAWPASTEDYGRYYTQTNFTINALKPVANLLPEFLDLLKADKNQAQDFLEKEKVIAEELKSQSDNEKIAKQLFSYSNYIENNKVTICEKQLSYLQIADSGSSPLLIEDGKIKIVSINPEGALIQVDQTISKPLAIFFSLSKSIKTDRLKQKTEKPSEELVTLYKNQYCMHLYLSENDFNYKGNERYKTMVDRISDINKDLYKADPAYCEEFMEYSLGTIGNVANSQD